MSKNHPRKINKSEIKIEPTAIAGVATSSKVEKPKEKTPFKTVGTVRLSKNGGAISIKLFADDRFLHISKRDIELILMDENHLTVCNVREYDKLNLNDNGA
jgi:hypothetical protein